MTFYECKRNREDKSLTGGVETFLKSLSHSHSSLNMLKMGRKNEMGQIIAAVSDF